MALIKCPECNKEISDTIKKCPHCGYKLAKKKGKKENVYKSLFVIVVILMVAVCTGGVVYYTLNHDPVAKYQRLVLKGKKQEAIELYNQKIKNDKEKNDLLIKKQTKELDAIYTDYLNDKSSYDKAIKAINVYKQYDSSKQYSNDIMEKVNRLKKSKEAYVSAEEFEVKGNLVNAIQAYNRVIEDDLNYDDATNKVKTLKNEYKKQLMDDAAIYAKKKQYTKAISSIEKAINYIGSEKELNRLLKTYKKDKDEMYVKVSLKDKSVTPKNIDNWIFSNYVNFVFTVKNNSNKAIKGVQGTAVFKDQFGEEILTMGCDFNGYTLKSGAVRKVTDLVYECNEFMDEDMKLYSTKYKDLKFEYKVTKIVFSDGKTVKPE